MIVGEKAKNNYAIFQQCSLYALWLSKKRKGMCIKMKNRKITVIIFCAAVSLVLTVAIIMFLNRPAAVVNGNIVTKRELEQMRSEDMVKIKIEQEMMLESGMVTDISYSSFLKELNEENLKRKKQLENNQAIYGPKQYTEKTYYNILHAKRLEELKELHRKDFRPNEGEINSLYKKTKENYNPLPTITVLEASGENKEDLMGIQLETTGKKRIFDQSTNRSDLSIQPLLYNAANKLGIGEISDVISENGRFYLLKCIERTDSSEAVSLEDLRPQLTEILFSEYFDRLVQERISLSQLKKVAVPLYPQEL